MNLLLSELDIAARTIRREAAPNDYDDRRSIAHVLKNRLTTTTGQFARDDTLATVCLRHLQFSVWNPGDPNFDKLYAVDYRDQDLRECLEALLTVFNGAKDITKGSLHYHTRAVSPSWSQGHTSCHQTPGHVFFNDID